MHKLLTGFVVLVAVAFLTVAPCQAQDTPYFEVSGGYNFLRYQQLAGGESLKKGGYADVALNLTSAIGLVGQVTGNAASDGLIVQTVLGGFRFSARGFGRGGGRAVGFLQILGGVLRYPDYLENYWAGELGGGVNIMVTNQAGIRIGAGYVRTFYADAISSAAGENFLRISAGATYGFGSR